MSRKCPTRPLDPSVEATGEVANERREAVGYGAITKCFQEMVPLNVGNVLGTEDNGPAKKWLSLVRQTLNNFPSINTSFSYSYSNPSPVPDPVAEMDADFEGNYQGRSNYPYFHGRSFQSLHSRSLRMNGGESIMMGAPQLRLECRYSVCERGMYGRRPSTSGL